MARDTAGDKDEGLYFSHDTKATEGSTAARATKSFPRVGLPGQRLSIYIQ